MNTTINGSVKALPVFIDNYAAIPSESIRRLLALREAGIIHILALGEDYKMEINESRTVLKTEDNSYSFDVFIDARGQRPLKVKDIPFPGYASNYRKQGMKSLMLAKIIRYSNPKIFVDA